MLKSDANQPALISGSSLKSGFPDDQAEFPDLRTPVIRKSEMLESLLHPVGCM